MSPNLSLMISISTVSSQLTRQTMRQSKAKVKLHQTMYDKYAINPLMKVVVFGSPDPLFEWLTPRNDTLDRSYIGR